MTRVMVSIRLSIATPYYLMRKVASVHHKVARYPICHEQCKPRGNEMRKICGQSWGDSTLPRAMSFLFFYITAMLSEHRCRGHDSEWTTVVRFTVIGDTSSNLWGR